MQIANNRTVTMLVCGLTEKRTEHGAASRPVAALSAQQDALLVAMVRKHGGTVYRRGAGHVSATYPTPSAALSTALAIRNTAALMFTSRSGERLFWASLHAEVIAEQNPASLDGLYRHTLAIAIAGAGSEPHILLSSVIRELVEDTLPADLMLQEAATSDAAHTGQVYRVVTPESMSGLHGVRSRLYNFPRFTHAPVRRERELVPVCALLRRPEVRLLSLTGPGGCGKTRMGIQAASELAYSFDRGAFFVGLGALTNPNLVLPSIGQVLGVKENQQHSLISSIQEHLGDHSLLLVLDNFEHLAAAAPIIGELLTIPTLKILATSRSALQIYGEYEFVVPPMTLPEATEQLTVAQLQTYDGIRLFVQRAQTVKPDFALNEENGPVVTEICRQLDGLPLALELAAARIRHLTPQALLGRLESRLNLLTSGSHDLPMRQQTMRSTLDWSYNLLTPAEQELFQRLAVFAGGWTLEDAEAVCGATLSSQGDILDLLAVLHSNSLIQELAATPGARFRMLETIREYAWEHLSVSGKLATLQRRHAEHYLALAERIEPELIGAQQQVWLDQLESEHRNLQAALSWALEQGERDMAVRFIAAIWKYWRTHNHQSEGLRWVAAVFSGAPLHEAAPGGSWARALYGAGWISFDLANLEQSQGYFETSLMLARALNDKRGIGMALHGVGEMVMRQGDHARATALYQESLDVFNELDDREEMAWTLTHLARVAWAQAEYQRPIQLFEECLALFRGVDHTYGVMFSLLHLGILLVQQERYEEAAPHFQESLTLSQALRNGWGTVASEIYLGRIALDCGERDGLIPRLEEALARARQVENLWGIAAGLALLARATLAAGRLEEAAVLYSQSLSCYPERESEHRWVLADAIAGVAWIAEQTGKLDQAARLWGFVEAMGEALQLQILAWSKRDPEHAQLLARLNSLKLSHIAAWAEGRSMRLERVISYALSV